VWLVSSQHGATSVYEVILDCRGEACGCATSSIAEILASTSTLPRSYVLRPVRVLGVVRGSGIGSRKLNTQDGCKPRPSNSVPKINTLDYQLEEGTAGAGVENTSLAIAQDRVRVLFRQQAEAAHLPLRTILDSATLMNCNAQAIPPNHVREDSNIYDCFRGATTRQICALCKGIVMTAQSGVDIRAGQ
jgi:hypothetical protein